MAAISLNINTDDRTNGLLRLATKQADSGDWGGAIATLLAARAGMVGSPIHYPPETWCKLPLYLSRAGRFDEADSAFDWLLEDLPRRARKESFMDEPAVSFGKGTSKKAVFNLIVKNTQRVVAEKRAIAQRRRSKAAD
jgi:hypothetical protein